MKVLHVYRTYFPDTQGGLEETVRQICISTRSWGMESEVLTLSPTAVPSRIEREEAVVYRARKNIDIASCGMGVGAWKLFRERIKTADVVHYHFPWPFADVLAALAPPQCPQVLTYHSDIVRQRTLKLLYRPLMHRFLRRMDAVVATSEAYAASSQVLGFHRDRLQVIPIGIDEQSYPVASPALVREVEVMFGREFFLFIGVLRQYKGIQYLLDAAKGSRCTVVIAGSGPMERSLRRQAHAMGLANVHFLGHVSDVMKMALLRVCRAFVLPSWQRSEAFGVSLLEAAMSGKALISTELGTGTSFINLHEVSGLVVPPGNAAALRVAMERLHDAPDQAEAFGRAAYARYCELFRADAMGSRYAALYADLCRPSGLGGGVAEGA